MNDADAIDVLRDLFALPETDDSRNLERLGIDRLRAAHGLMATWGPKVAALINTADMQDLAEARARVAEIEARLNILPNPIRRESTPAPAPQSDFDQTDAGMGIGGRREAAQSAEELQDELHELRQRGAAKRGRRA